MERLELTDYSRQADMDNALRFDDNNKTTTRIIIIGCGGIGFWVGLFYAMMGFKNFVLIDGETLDTSNVARIPVPQTWVGRNKTIALRKLIHQLRPDCCIQIIPAHFNDVTEHDITGIVTTGFGSKIVCDTTDDARTQKRLSALFGDVSRVSYVKMGYEGFKVGNYKNMDTWIDEETYRPGYRTSSANVISSAISAGLGIFADRIRHNTTRGDTDFNLNLHDLLVPQQEPEEDCDDR